MTTTPKKRLIRLADVCDRTGLPRSSVYKRMRDDPTFPRTVNIGGRTVAWVEAEVDAWVDQQVAARPTAPTAPTSPTPSAA